MSTQTPAPSSPPPTIIIQQGSGSLLWKVLGTLGWVGVLICVPIILGLIASQASYFDTSGGVREKYHSLSRDARDKVAIIDVSGIIMEGDGFVKRQIELAEKDDSVKAVVVRVDSPGGTITGSDYIFHHLKRLRKEKNIPVVVSMGGICASGGYYVSMAVGDQENSIYAEPTTTTGSIGVIVPHYDFSGLMAEWHVEDDSITSHPHKQMLSMTRKLTPEMRTILEGYVKEAFDRFKEVVREGRPGFRGEGEEQLDALATGEIFNAVKAKKLGLVDELGFIEDAIARAIELAKLDKENVRVVKYESPKSLVDVLAAAEANTPGAEMKRMLELSVPRGYYMCTTLPPLVHSLAK